MYFNNPYNKLLRSDKGEMILLILLIWLRDYYSAKASNKQFVNDLKNEYYYCEVNY